MGTSYPHTQGTRMHRAVIAWGLALHLAVIPSRAQAPVRETEILRAAIGDWQEGPTDGRICLDARVLSADAEHPRASAPVWPSAILDAVLADSMIAIARGTLRASERYRACSPSRTRPQLALSRPIRAHGGFVVVSAIQYGAESRSEGEEPARPIRIRALIGLRAGRWTVLGRPDMHFKVLRAPI